MLAEYDMEWSIGKLSPSFNWKDSISHNTAPLIPERFLVKFVDNDLAKSTIEGDVAILLYLEAIYGSQKEALKSQLQTARNFTRLQHADSLLDQWRATPLDVNLIRRTLALWDNFASENSFIAGPTISVADFAFWPVLHHIVEEWGEGIESPHLKGYHARMLEQDSAQKALNALESVDVNSGKAIG